MSANVRFNPDGSENGDFILNQAPSRGARILVTAENFGRGSSRESAVWALMDAREIEALEAKHAREMPWLFAKGA